ncbi:hypothetical protein [Neisseria iguanae]|uniref:hypothetical protein n=1 Tax=Neisseria iguanae TaxID=90242 RepID=UPI003CCB7EB3
MNRRFATINRHYTRNPVFPNKISYNIRSNTFCAPVEQQKCITTNLSATRFLNRLVADNPELERLANLDLLRDVGLNAEEQAGFEAAKWQKSLTPITKIDFQTA